MYIESKGREETFSIGKSLGEKARPGQIFTLDGELGVGKTVFAKGFAEGIGVEEAITSPTFTIVQEYQSGRIPFYHFDAYRVADPEEMYEIGFEDYLFGEGVCMIEWASLIEDILPEKIIRVKIRKDSSCDFDHREILIEGMENENSCN